MRDIILLIIVLVAGCGAINSDVQNQKSAQASNTAQKSGFTQAKTQQWFSPDTPETLPPDKIKKLSLGVGGFGGAY